MALCAECLSSVVMMGAGLLELLTAILAAVLNLSTLVANQPKIARRGLLVLLKTNSSLFEVVSTRVSVLDSVCRDEGTAAGAGTRWC